MRRHNSGVGHCSVNAHHPQLFKCFFPWLLFNWMTYFRMALCPSPESTNRSEWPWPAALGFSWAQEAHFSSAEDFQSLPELCWKGLQLCLHLLDGSGMYNVVTSPALSPASPHQVPWPWFTAYSWLTLFPAPESACHGQILWDGAPLLRLQSMLESPSVPLHLISRQANFFLASTFSSKDITFEITKGPSPMCIMKGLAKHFLNT